MSITDAGEDFTSPGDQEAPHLHDGFEGKYNFSSRELRASDIQPMSAENVIKGLLSKGIMDKEPNGNPTYVRGIEVQVYGIHKRPKVTISMDSSAPIRRIENAVTGDIVTVKITSWDTKVTPDSTLFFRKTKDGLLQPMHREIPERNKPEDATAE